MEGKKHFNRTLLIVGIVVVAVLGLGFIIVKIAGNTILSRILSKNSGGNVNVEGGGKKVTYTGKEGEFSFEQTDKLPEGFPNDFPIYPGAKLTSTWSAKDKNGGGLSLVWETNDALDKVSQFFKSQLEEKGWKVNTSFTQTDSATYSFEKGTVNGFVGIVKKDSSVTISVTLGNKEE